MPMKKIVKIITLLVVLISVYIAWIFLGPSVHAPVKKYFYISTNENYKGVLASLRDSGIISSEKKFDFVAGLVGYKTIKPGRYEIKKGISFFKLARILKNGNQSPVNLTIIKFRTKENFAAKISGMFEFDSRQMMNFLTSNDSLKQFGLDTNTVMAGIMPNTYTYFWNTTPKKVFQKIYTESQKFWTSERKLKAEQLRLTPLQVTILASIIDEETNQVSEKKNISSVYLNRMNIGMPLQSCPTIKFALKDFGLKRIYEKHIAVESPFNTYKNTGLPPGPICTPQPSTIDLVLNAPKTDYLYFVAKSDFSDAHEYTTNYADHLKKAKEYQQVLDRQEAIRKARKEYK